MKTRLVVIALTVVCSLQAVSINVQAQTQNTIKAEKGIAHIKVLVDLDPKVPRDTRLSGNIQLHVRVKNTSSEKVALLICRRDIDVSLLEVSKTGERTLVNFNSGLAVHVMPMWLMPGETHSVDLTIPTTLIKQKDQKYVVEVVERAHGNKEEKVAVESESFTLGY